MLRLLLTLTLLIPTLVRAQDYYVHKLPSQIVENRLEKIEIQTTSELVFGTLPKHPKIIWLENSSRRVGDNLNLNTLDFVVTVPGLLEFPPIPIVYDNKEFFIRLDDVRVLRNPSSQTDTSLTVYWNESDSPPQQVHLGESVEIRFLEMAKKENESFRRAYLSMPSNRVNGGQWHQYVEIAGRRALPQDFFFSYARSFWDGGNRNYQAGEKEIDGEQYDLRIYKARLYFTKLGMATGHLSATLGTDSAKRRTHVIPFNIEVLPLPPLPNSRAIDSGLIGEWKIQSSVSPPQPLASKQLSIRVAVQGSGNPKLRNRLDFSGEGFPSVEDDWHFNANPNYDEWNAIFEQTLIPTGKTGTLPERTLAYFDTLDDEWKFHQVTPALTLPGFTDATASLKPRDELGEMITRPVLLNLPTLTFAAFAFAPLLPFIFASIKRRRDARDPALEARRKTLKKLIELYQSDQTDCSSIDHDLLPLLREHLELSQGATTQQIAETLDDKELGLLLKSHSESSFSANAHPTDLRAIAARLAKFSLMVFLGFSNVDGATLEKANTAFRESHYTSAANLYQELLKEHSGSPSLYFNLAQAYLLLDDPGRARAACHTAILLDPLDQEAHDLMSEIRKRQGDETLTGSRLFSLRPDQWLTVAALIWLIAFLFYGVGKFRKIPRWPGHLAVLISLSFVATAFWSQQYVYAQNQYMVLPEELPREPEAGTPNWDYPALRAGQIITVSETTKTHALVSSSDRPFWLPINELQQVW